MNDSNYLLFENSNIKLNENLKEFYKFSLIQHRNNILKNTDKYLLADYPISSDQLNIIKDFRQKLRDFTVNNYILPHKPDFINDPTIHN